MNDLAHRYLDNGSGIIRSKVNTLYPQRAAILVDICASLAAFSTVHEAHEVYFQ